MTLVVLGSALLTNRRKNQHSWCNATKTNLAGFFDNLPEDRTCRICGSPNEIEDESHILLHCPGLADLRSAHSHLFAEHQQSLATLFEQPPSRVATYIRAALLQHASVLGITGGASGPT